MGNSSHWGKCVGDFLREWFKLASVGGSVVTWIVKGMIFIPTLLFAIGDNTKLDVRFLTKSDEGVDEMVLIWQPTMGWTAFLSVMIVWLAIAGGITWARFKRLEIGKKLEYDHGPDEEHGWHVYRLPIRNLSMDMTVPVFAEAIADEQKILDVPKLPVELSWLHEDPNAPSPVLVKGVLRKANIFKLWPCDQPPRIAVYFLGKNKREVLGGLLSKEKKKLWIAIAIGDHNTTRWFSIEAIDDFRSCKVEAEQPPFL